MVLYIYILNKKKKLLININVLIVYNVYIILLYN